MNRYLVKTRDNSATLFVPELDEHYHSIHGALQESLHVFIRSGLHSFSNYKELRILEIGFGTGLNALLTLLEAEKTGQNIHYTSIEKYPLTKEESSLLKYEDVLNDTEATDTFKMLHDVDWEKDTYISENFTIHKQKTDLKTFSGDASFDLIYFDAFAPSAQPELWTQDIFNRMYTALKPGGMLVTYCVKGEVRRNMQAAGFDVKKIPGPPGKREMAIAFKSI